MELKTKVEAEEGRQDLFITRAFDLSVEKLFTAYTDPEIIEYWMGTKVLLLDNKKYGCFLFETTDPKGNKHQFTGTIHDLIAPTSIIRTFEFVGMPMGVQIEFLSFKPIADDRSILSIHSIYQTVAQRDHALKMPFAFGLSMAHDRLQNRFSTSK